MNKNHTIITQENIILPNGKKIVLMSSKKPFIDEAGNIAGVIGISIDITLCAYVSPWTVKHSPDRPKKILNLTGQWTGTSLTSRQAECAYYLCRGKTLQEIATILTISPRTVEDYIKQLKVKLGCFKKSALIEILLSDGIFPDLINFISS